MPSSRYAAYFLQATAVCSQALVQGDGVALGVFPVTDAGWDLPVLLLSHCDCARRRVHDRHRGRPRAPRYLLVPELGRLHRIHWHVLRRQLPHQHLGSRAGSHAEQAGLHHANKTSLRHLQGSICNCGCEPIGSLRCSQAGTGNVTRCDADMAAAARHAGREGRQAGRQVYLHADDALAGSRVVLRALL